MISILHNIVLQIIFIISLVSVGGLLTKLFFKRATGIYALALAITCGVTYYAIIGLMLVTISQVLTGENWKILRFVSVIIILLSIIVPVVISFKSSSGFSFGILGFYEWKKPIVFWVILSAISFSVTQIPVKFPDQLVDGPYVIKNHNLNVKIQLINGNLPADNLIPFLVTEYLAKGISFKQEHPILPGQAVSNRPILMSLTALPFRLAYVSSSKQNGSLGTFEYVGQNWPNVAKLSGDKYYSKFLLIAIVLNSSIIVALFLFISAFNIRKFENYLVAIFILNPYTLSQCMFVWPKFLAAFFILLALYSLREKHSPWLVGISISLSYLSHPYALIFMGSILIYYFLDVFILKSRNFSHILKYLFPFLLSYFVWLFWTRFYLGFASDLVSQNFISGMGMENFLWVRMVNFYNLLSPRIFSQYPLNPDGLLSMSIVSLPSMVGFLFFIQSYMSVFNNFKNDKEFIVFGIIIPTILIVVIFSYVAVPALHGMQVIFTLLFVFIGKFYQLLTGNGIKLFKLLVLLQICINFYSVYPYMKKIGVFT
ncbi:TPA: hypothetical protein ACYHOP_003064 [Vibrio cholerae]|nr:hypothetical protein VCSRO178_2664 [Vibrio cholerae]